LLPNDGGQTFCCPRFKLLEVIETVTLLIISSNDIEVLFKLSTKKSFGRKLSWLGHFGQTNNSWYFFFSCMIIHTLSYLKHDSRQHNVQEYFLNNLICIVIEELNAH